MSISISSFLFFFLLAGAFGVDVKIERIQAVHNTSVALLSLQLPSNFHVPRDGLIRIRADCPKLLNPRVFDFVVNYLPNGPEAIHIPQFEVLGYHVLEVQVVAPPNRKQNSKRKRTEDDGEGGSGDVVIGSDRVVVGLELDDDGNDELVLVSPPIYPEFFTSHVPDQDYKYMEIFGFRTNGTFVEVGANDGKAYSNTYALAEIGWRGLYIDPSPSEVRICTRNHQRHPRVSVHQAAISSYNGETEVHLAGAMSTIVPEMVDLFRSISWATEMNAREEWVKTRVVTLNDFLVENRVRREFELLVIDAEGSELDIMQGFDIDYWRPEAVLVELMDFHPDFNKSERVVNNCQSVRRFLEGAGYSIYWQDVADTLYVANPEIQMQHDSTPIRQVIDGEVVSH